MIVNVDVTPRPNEPFDRFLRRFTKKCSKEGIIKEHTESLQHISNREYARRKHLRALRKAQKKKR